MLPLAGAPRLTMLGREVRLGGGYADLIAVESTGRLVIIEVKLAGNAESRRAVVAQVLSYAGYLQGLDPEQLETQILAPYLTAGGSVLAAVEAGDQQHALDPEAFREGLTRSLADGSFRLVIVLDSAPDELVQVVGYLQSVTDKIDIDLVTITAYDVAGSRFSSPSASNPRAGSAKCPTPRSPHASQVHYIQDPLSSGRSSPTSPPSGATCSPGSLTGPTPWQTKDSSSWPCSAATAESPRCCLAS